MLLGVIKVILGSPFDTIFISFQSPSNSTDHVSTTNSSGGAIPSGGDADDDLGRRVFVPPH